MQPTQTELCPLCGNTNQCSLADGAENTAPCWCFGVTVSQEALAQIPPEQINKACLCPRCAAGISASAIASEAK
tara:strand:+ start:41473 stop:41694 length:222 start_codon:yes stop_codon:yes gene_type:complete